MVKLGRIMERIHIPTGHSPGTRNDDLSFYIRSSGEVYYGHGGGVVVYSYGRIYLDSLFQIYSKILVASLSVHGLGWCILCLPGWLHLPRRHRCRQFLRLSPVTPGTGRVLCVDLDGETNYYYGGYGFDPSNYSYGRCWVS